MSSIFKKRASRQTVALAHLRVDEYVLSWCGMYSSISSNLSATVKHGRVVLQ